MNEFTTQQICRAVPIQASAIDNWYDNGNSVIVVLRTGTRLGISKNKIRASLRSKENERDIENSGVHCGADIDRADSVHNGGSD